MNSNQIKTNLEKATPGPWEIKREDIGDEHFCYVPIEIIGSDTFPIVSMEGGLAPNCCAFTAETLEANAHLIAAAPDMYEALLAIQEAFMRRELAYTRKRKSDSDPYHPSNVLMCKALAKADGRDD